jgi:hypothetical protein
VGVTHTPLLARHKQHKACPTALRRGCVRAIVRCCEMWGFLRICSCELDGIGVPASTVTRSSLWRILRTAY